VKLGAAVLFLCFWGLAFATFAQEEHLIKDTEIPLDDFPVLMAGYRIQIGAFISESTAAQLKQKLSDQFQEKTHLSFTDGLWRVRIGDFQDSAQCAEFLQSFLLPQGYFDAEIKNDRIPVSVESIAIRPGEPGYRIQFMALSDRETALDNARDLACRFRDLQAHVILSDSLYKIQFGDFRLQSEAEAWKIEMGQVDSLAPMIVPAQVHGPVPPPPSQRTPEEDIFKYDD
jgi:hypothetical protein